LRLKGESRAVFKSKIKNLKSKIFLTRNPKLATRNLHVARPCPADWGRMRGDDRVRFCEQCGLNVYNLSAMSAAEAAGLLARSEGRLCVRFYRRADGTLLTEDCPVGVRRWRRRVSRAAVAALTALLSLFGGTALAARRAPVQGEWLTARVRVDRVKTQAHDPLPVASGVVRDVAGAVVAGARVVLTAEGGKKKFTSATDDEGRFRLPAVEPGTYTVAVESPGFRSFTSRPLKLEAGEDISLEVTLFVEEPPGLTPAGALR
jgi:hypothetical protein